MSPVKCIKLNGYARVLQVFVDGRKYTIFLLINDKVPSVYDCSSPDKKQPSEVCI